MKPRTCNLSGLGLQIGLYILRPAPYGNDVWIERANDGEGGSFSLEKLEKVIDQFYKDNF